MHLVCYVEANRHLMETPPSVPTQFASDTETARQVIAEALAAGKTWLDPLDVNRLLDAYGIPVAPAIFARNGKEAVAAARPFLQQGQGVVVKVLSPDIIHKSDVDGVRLNLTSEKAVEAETEDILKRAHAARPAARLSGVTVHPMVVRPKARELIIGLADDPTFGPVVVFGSGGTAVEVVDDKALALPPLDLELAGDLIDRTWVSRLLRGYRNIPPADRQALELMLVKVAQLAADLPEVRELDLNPGVLPQCHRIRPATALLRSGEGIQPHLHRPTDADRLFAHHGFPRPRRRVRADAGGGTTPRRREPRDWRVRYSASVRSQGPRARLAIDADDDRVCVRRRLAGDRRTGAARQYDHAADVRRARLQGRA
jgi:acetyltransferase